MGGSPIAQPRPSALDRLRISSRTTPLVLGGPATRRARHAERRRHGGRRRSTWNRPMGGRGADQASAEVGISESENDPAMNSSTIVWQTLSAYCTGGDFMK
jgi:hypothetical protein